MWTEEKYSLSKSFRGQCEVRVSTKESEANRARMQSLGEETDIGYQREHSDQHPGEPSLSVASFSLSDLNCDSHMGEV